MCGDNKSDIQSDVVLKWLHTPDSQINKHRELPRWARGFYSLLNPQNSCSHLCCSSSKSSKREPLTSMWSVTNIKSVFSSALLRSSFCLFLSSNSCILLFLRLWNIECVLLAEFYLHQLFMYHEPAGVLSRGPAKGISVLIKNAEK